MGAIAGFFKSIGVWVDTTFSPPPSGWTGAAVGVFVAWLFLVGSLFLNGILADYTPYKRDAFLWFVGMQLLFGLGLVAGFAVLRALAFRYRSALFLFGSLVIFFSLGIWGMPGGVIATAVVLGGLSLFFGAVFTLIAHGWAPWRHVLTYLMLILGGAAAAVSGWAYYFANEEANPALAGYQLEDRTLDLPNPGRMGEFEVETYSYGSGKDLHRPEYGAEASWTSRAVDGSKLVSNWTDARKAYWGFDASAMSVQGRVWAPKGEGPFPLVLIVHGNHSMEDYSDTGYGYLGEMFASRGYIFVSVDENFLNSSFADFAEGGLREENDARGWMLLEHFSQWAVWNGTAGHPFRGRVDMDRLAMIGHSRGGEAVAIAAAFNRLERYPDNALQSFDYNHNIRGVIAIAPVDGQYRPRRVSTPMKDVNYFVIHGSFDGDVTSFMGASQWTRAEFSGDDFRFKASLYVTGANHGQFNTGWGRLNNPNPFALFLDTGPIMPSEDQRQIAKVYFGAFLDAAVLGKTEYLPLLKDARKGAEWLPDTFYINNYQDTADQILAGYDEDLEALTASAADGQIGGAHLSKWRETSPSLKWAPLGTHMVLLAWDERVAEETAQYQLKWDAAQTAVHEDTVLRFAAAQSVTGTLPPGWTPTDETGEKSDEADSVETNPASLFTGSAFRMPFMEVQAFGNRLGSTLGFMQEGDADGNARQDLLDWTIVAVDAGGEEARLPLSHDSLLYPRIEAPVTRVQALSSRRTSELVMRYFAFPMRDFAARNPNFDPQTLSEVRFEFDRSKRGAVLIDDIGLAGDAVTVVPAEPEEAPVRSRNPLDAARSYLCRTACQQ